MSGQRPGPDPGFYRGLALAMAWSVVFWGVLFFCAAWGQGWRP